MPFTSLVDLVFYTLQGLILAHVILSWLGQIGPRPRWLRHPVVRWVDDAGFRLLRPVRRVLDRLGVSGLTGGWDFSPVVAFFVLGWLHSLVARLIW
jgi:uncharacterized protein YggT (Ycf19 family)